MESPLNNYQIFFAKVNQLKPLEGFISTRADDLYKEIFRSGIWTTPLVIDNQHGLIMDGHHRHQVAMRLGLIYVPVVAWNYNQVDVWSLRDTEEVTVKRILQNYKDGIIYPNKTAKHGFPFSIESNLEINIDELK
jgi:L-serine kinase (ADP)